MAGDLLPLTTSAISNSAPVVWVVGGGVAAVAAAAVTEYTNIEAGHG